MFYQLPPTGNPMQLHVGSRGGPVIEQLFAPWQAVYYQSGTAALAAAIQVALHCKQAALPEVILPAYGCPDLVSAVLHAGATPVLVDLQPERPWLDIEKLETALNPNTVAVVAVNLLGIQERIDAIRSVAQRVSALVIEDSAQGFPGGDTENFWKGDLVVLSFGRGKPVTLLGGGAVLCRDESLQSLLPHQVAAATGRLSLQLKAHLYNLMSHPRCYWLPASLPFLHLGETRFHPLGAVQGMDAARRELLVDNVNAFRRYARHLQAMYAQGLQSLSAQGAPLVDWPAVCGLPPDRFLLRYPVLIPADRRAILFERMNRLGLGASILYPAILPAIAGIEGLAGSPGACPEAGRIAARLLTLPLHSRVREADATALLACLEALL